jgi:DNA-binding protein Fis
MPLANKIFVYSDHGEAAGQLEDCIRGFPCQVDRIKDFDQLRGFIEGGLADFILIDVRGVRDRFLQATGEEEPENLLSLPLAEIEKRHIFRVLSSTGGNKTRAAKILGIDTKTLYNKLKSYQVGMIRSRNKAANSVAPQGVSEANTNS